LEDACHETSVTHVDKTFETMFVPLIHIGTNLERCQAGNIPRGTSP
jgi:hypothetical protein